MTDKNFAAEQERLDKTQAYIRLRMEQAHMNIDEKRRELVSYRAFLWENYYENMHEMDTHQEAIDRAVDSYRLDAGEADKLRLLYGAPYFARIDITPDDTGEPEQVYIGPTGLYDSVSFAPWVYDWRSPVASMYYEYDLGRAAYTCAEGDIGVDMSLKRQFSISGGKLHGMFDTSVAIRDALLIELLSGGASAHMAQICASIQKEQNRVVRGGENSTLIVSGVAGSGKTSVALHRAAWLMYRQRASISADNITIFSPNSLFSDYIAEVLPSLGEKNVYQTTFADLAGAGVGAGAGVQVQPAQEYLEDVLDGAVDRTRLKAAAMKAEPDFARALDAFASALDSGTGEGFADVRIGGDMAVTAREMAEIYAASRGLLRPESRLERIRTLFATREREMRRERIERIADELEFAAEPGVYLSRAEAVDDAKRRHAADTSRARERLEACCRMDACALYAGFLDDYFARRAPLEARRFRRALRGGLICYEDAAPLVYLRLRLGQLRPIRRTRQVIVDEAQDYSILQYRALRLIYPAACFTILGDPGQRLDPSLHYDGFGYIREIFEGAEVMELGRCYRLTQSISAFADSISGKRTPCLERGGEPVEIADTATAQERAERIAAFFGGSRGPDEMCAVITRTLREAILLQRLLPRALDARLIAARERDELGGVMVLPIYLAKGLEFNDVALVTDGSDPAFEYVAATRAMRRLLVLVRGRGALE